MTAPTSRALSAALLIAVLSAASFWLASCDRSPGGGAANDESRQTGAQAAANAVSAADEPTSDASDPAAALDDSPSDEPTPGTWNPAAAFDEIAPDGFQLGSLGETPPDEIAAIMAGRTVPLTTTIAVFASDAEPTQMITATLLTYGDAAGPLAMYNSWFAEYGFIPVAERRQVPFGDQAECFDAGWPPFHAVVLRQGPLFALVQADSEVPLERCAALLGQLLADATS